MIFQHIIRVFQGKIFPSIYNLSIIADIVDFLRVSTLSILIQNGIKTKHAHNFILF